MLKSRTYLKDDMPYKWKVYGSLDGVNFTLIDTKTSYNLLETGSCVIFTPLKQNFKLRYLKVVQTINYNSRYYFCLNKIELFGEYIPDNEVSKTSKCTCNRKMNVLLL